jgi:hypothetical protein
MEARQALLPGLNPHAASVENVYPIDAVLPVDVFKALTGDADTLKTAVKAPTKIEELRTCVVDGCVYASLVCSPHVCEGLCGTTGVVCGPITS